VTAPWGEMMRAAALLGIAPEAFWRLSLKEWRMLAGGGLRAGAPSRATMERMQERWPDER
jgi:uncharacterized phage protein (TIGR02216 family)